MSNTSFNNCYCSPGKMKLTVWKLLNIPFTDIQCQHFTMHTSISYRKTMHINIYILYTHSTAYERNSRWFMCSYSGKCNENRPVSGPNLLPVQLLTQQRGSGRRHCSSMKEADLLTVTGSSENKNQLWNIFKCWAVRGTKCPLWRNYLSLCTSKTAPLICKIWLVKEESDFVLIERVKLNTIPLWSCISVPSTFIFSHSMNLNVLLLNAKLETFI